MRCDLAQHQDAESFCYGVVPYVSHPALGIASRMVGVGANRGSVIAVQLYVRIRLGRHSETNFSSGSSTSAPWSLAGLNAPLYSFGCLNMSTACSSRRERTWLDIPCTSRIDRCQVRLQAKHRLRTIYQGLCELEGLRADGLF